MAEPLYRKLMAFPKGPPIVYGAQPVLVEDELGFDPGRRCRTDRTTQIKAKGRADASEPCSEEWWYFIDGEMIQRGDLAYWELEDAAKERGLLTSRAAHSTLYRANKQLFDADITKDIKEERESPYSHVKQKVRAKTGIRMVPSEVRQQLSYYKDLTVPQVYWTDLFQNDPVCAGRKRLINQKASEASKMVAARFTRQGTTLVKEIQKVLRFWYEETVLENRAGNNGDV